MALALATCLLPSIVRAQPADGERPPDAASLFEAGTTAIREGRFAEARDLLREAHERVRRVGTAFNLAVALRGTGEVVACTELFDALLASEFGEVPEATRAQALPLREECATLRARLALRVVGPPRSEVLLDGRAVGEVASGDEDERWLDPGSHVLTIRAPGWQEQARPVSLGRGEVRAEVFRLDPDVSLARLTVRGHPPESVVEIDGVGRGPSPFERALEPGSYTVRLLVDDVPATAATVALEAGEERALTLDATRGLLDEPLFWTIGAVLLAGVAAAVTATVLLVPVGVAPPVGTPLFPQPVVIH